MFAFQHFQSEEDLIAPISLIAIAKKVELAMTVAFFGGRGIMSGSRFVVISGNKEVAFMIDQSADGDASVRERMRRINLIANV